MVVLPARHQQPRSADRIDQLINGDALVEVGVQG
jgi:hypothetical protein